MDDEHARPMRTGMLANRLRSLGHDVTWWASQYSHKAGAMRHPTAETIELPNGTTMRLMEALGYSRNVSLRRLKDHRHVAKDFLKQSHALQPPDVIVLSYPPIEMGLSAVRYCAAHNVPLLVDVRDQYPDLYWMNRPLNQQALAKAISRLAGFQRDARRVLAAAQGITANGQGALEWALGYAGRSKRADDAVIPMSFEPPSCDGAALQSAQEDWLTKHPDWEREPLFLYAGALGQTLDFELLAELCRAAERFPVRIALCGSGDRQSDIAALAQACKRTEYLGNLDSIRLAALQKIATWGLVPYRANTNFEGGIPNKPVECLAQGLPVLSTLTKGQFAEIAQREGVSFPWTEPEEALRQAIALFPERATLRQKAVQTFNDHFHPDRPYRAWIDLIERVASTPK